MKIELPFDYDANSIEDAREQLKMQYPEAELIDYEVIEL